MSFFVKRSLFYLSFILKNKKQEPKSALVLVKMTILQIWANKRHKTPVAFSHRGYFI